MLLLEQDDPSVQIRNSTVGVATIVTSVDNLVAVLFSLSDARYSLSDVLYFNVWNYSFWHE